MEATEGARQRGTWEEGGDFTWECWDQCVSPSVSSILRHSSLKSECVLQQMDMRSQPLSGQTEPSSSRGANFLGFAVPSSLEGNHTEFTGHSILSFSFSGPCWQQEFRPPTCMNTSFQFIFSKGALCPLCTQSQSQDSQAICHPILHGRCTAHLSYSEYVWPSWWHNRSL